MGEMNNKIKLKLSDPIIITRGEGLVFILVPLIIGFIVGIIFTRNLIILSLK